MFPLTQEQQNSLLKTKLFIGNKSVFLSKRCLILLICNNWFMQLGPVLGICTLQGRYRSIHAPRSLAYETGEIVFPNMNKEI